MRLGLVGVVVVGALVTGCGSDSGDPTPNARDEGVGWSAELLDPPVGLALADEAVNPIAVGDLAVLLGDEQLTAYDVTTGDQAWQTAVPGYVCAGSRSASEDGIVAVLVGTEEDCSTALAVDTADGSVRWRAPVPRAGDAFGHEVAVGPAGVVVSGECAGFTVLALDDGSVTSSVPGETVEGRCASATSDGTTAVLASAGTLTAYDAASGESRGSWPAPGPGRVGDVLSADPLVATARFASGGQLLDLSGDELRSFGRDAGGFGGEPVASVAIGDTLWVQYEDDPQLVGYDLASGTEVSTVDTEGDATLAGVQDDRLVLATAAEVRLVDPAAPRQPEIVTLPAGRAGDGAVTGSAVVSGHLVRLWPGRIEGLPLP